MGKVSGSNKKTLGSVRAKAGLPAKAGRRKPPAARNGKHITTPEQRARGRFLASLGLKPYTRPVLWRGEAAQ